MKPLNILIVTSSQIIAGGLHATLQRSVLSLQATSAPPDPISRRLHEKIPHGYLLIDRRWLINFGLTSAVCVNLLPQATIVAICSCLLPKKVHQKLRRYTLSIYDNPSSLADIIGPHELLMLPIIEDTKVLSQREEGVVVGIVKDLSNKGNRCRNNVSVNTVMTHRLNT